MLILAVNTHELTKGAFSSLIRAKVCHFNLKLHIDFRLSTPLTKNFPQVSPNELVSSMLSPLEGAITVKMKGRSQFKGQ